MMCLHGINLHLLLSSRKEVVIYNFYLEAISFTSVVSDLLLQCRKSPVHHLFFQKIEVPHNTPGHLHSVMQGAEKDEPSAQRGLGEITVQESR